ncbi:MAG: L-rhamnose mutarotase [Humibacter sp.]
MTSGPSSSSSSSSSSTSVIAWRTRLLPGQEEAYARTHRRVPESLANALREAGVVEWRIWRDGLTLVHLIETTHGKDEMERRLAQVRPSDPDWDALIATMVDQDPATMVELPLIWGLDGAGQRP